MGTVEGLASAFMDLLEEASWADRVHVLRALLRLLPDLSREFCSRLQGTLLHLLNLEQPPSLQVSASPPAGPTLPWAQGTDLALHLRSGPGPETVCDAGAAAAPGVLPGVPRGGAGADVLLPLLASPLPVSPAPTGPLRCGRPPTNLPHLLQAGAQETAGWTRPSGPAGLPVQGNDDLGPGPRPRVQGHTAQALLPEAGGNDTAAAGLGGPGGGRAGQPTHGASCLLPRLSPSPGGRRREPGEASGLLSLLPLCASSVLPYPVPVSQDLPVPPQAEGKVGSLPWTLVHPPLAVSPAEGDLAAVCSQVVRGAAQGLRDLRTSAPF